MEHWGCLLIKSNHREVMKGWKRERRIAMRREEDDERDVGTVISLSLSPPQRRDVEM